MLQLVPWFIVAFLVLAVIRSLGLIPPIAQTPIKTAASVLTTISMAALGLGVDVRVVARAGPSVTSAVTLSLVVLGVLSMGLIWYWGSPSRSRSREDIQRLTPGDLRPNDALISGTLSAGSVVRHSSLR